MARLTQRAALGLSSERVKAKGRFSAEFELALASARWPLRARDIEEIRQLTNGPLDWDQFVRIINRNQILPLAYRNLRDAFPDGSHTKILDSLRSKVVGFASHSLSQAAELIRVTESVTNAGFEIVALKGVSLSVLGYGNMATRISGDIDLLVSAAHVFEVERLLLELGYTRYEPRAELTPRRLKHYMKYYEHFAYVCEAKAIPLELHWRLFHGLPLPKEAETTFPPTMPVRVGAGVVSTLSRDELFLYLCVHGAIHGWPILKWLADLGALLSAMMAEDLARVAVLASERGLIAELRAALILVDFFLAVDRPTVELPHETNPVAERIVDMAQRLLTAKNYCLEIHRLPRLGMFLYHVRLRSSWRYRSRDIRRALFFPEDWDLVDLPDALFPLYAVVRPVSWLLRHLPRLPRRRSPVDSSSRSLSS